MSANLKTGERLKVNFKKYGLLLKNSLTGILLIIMAQLSRNK
jgi:hypothetical protein